MLLHGSTVPTEAYDTCLRVKRFAAEATITLMYRFYIEYLPHQLFLMISFTNIARKYHTRPSTNYQSVIKIIISVIRVKYPSMPS